MFMNLIVATTALFFSEPLSEHESEVIIRAKLDLIEDYAGAQASEYYFCQMSREWNLSPFRRAIVFPIPAQNLFDGVDRAFEVIKGRFGDSPRLTNSDEVLDEIGVDWDISPTDCDNILIPNPEHLRGIADAAEFRAMTLRGEFDPAAALENYVVDFYRTLAAQEDGAFMIEVTSCRRMESFEDHPSRRFGLEDFASDPDEIHRMRQRFSENYAKWRWMEREARDRVWSETWEFLAPETDEASCTATLDQLAETVERP